MFQGSPNEFVRNRVPFGFEPATIDAVVLTHAHLDHCGLLPLLVKGGFRGAIHATDGTVELATLVLLDSGHLHEEFAKREARWEKRNPDKAVRRRPRGARRLRGRGRARAGRRAEHVATSVEPEPRPERPRRRAGPTAAWPRDPEAELRAQPPAVDLDLDAPLYTVKDAERALEHFRPTDYDDGGRGRAGRLGDVRRRRAHPGLGHHPAARARPRRRRGRAGHRLLRATWGDPARRSCATRPISPTPTTSSSSRRTAAASTSRRTRPSASWPRPCASWRRPTACSSCPSFAIGRTQEVVWELDRLLDRGEIPQPAAVPRLADGVEGVATSTAATRSTTTRRPPGCCATATRPLDYPDQIVTNDYKAVAGDRARAAAVHDRGLERDADRRSHRRPPAAT